MSFKTYELFVSGISISYIFGQRLWVTKSNESKTMDGRRGRGDYC
jgi:hypothetical protein